MARCTMLNSSDRWPYVTRCPIDAILTSISFTDKNGLTVNEEVCETHYLEYIEAKTRGEFE